MVSNSSNSSAQSVHRRYSLLVLTTCYHHHLPPPTYYYLTDLTAFPRISTTYYTTTRHPIPSHPIHFSLKHNNHNHNHFNCRVFVSRYTVRYLTAGFLLPRRTFEYSKFSCRKPNNTSYFLPADSEFQEIDRPTYTLAYLHTAGKGPADIHSIYWPKEEFPTPTSFTGLQKRESSEGRLKITTAEGCNNGKRLGLFYCGIAASRTASPQ